MQKAVCCDNTRNFFFYHTGETSHGANYWWGTNRTDTNIVPPRQTLCLQIWRQNIKYTLAFACFVQLFAAEKLFLSCIIIYKSYKCYNMTLIGELCWLINLDGEAIVFPFITQNLCSIMWHVINTSTYCCVWEWKLSNFSCCFLL
jgi:hypothetical protein